MSNINLPYDIKNPQSIEKYAKNLIGKTFFDIISSSHFNSDSFDKDYLDYGNISRKGGLGNLLEEKYFGYKANSESKADFSEAGVELKVSPYEITQKGTFRAGERLVLTMINYNTPIENNFYDSHLWKKCRLILLVYYWRNRAINNNLLYQIKYVSLFTPSETDLVIIENDYKIISDKIKNGKAENLSESDTFYLGACTKGATAESSIVKQFYPPYSLAKKRAFCYKNSYMTFVLNEYIIKNAEKLESVVKFASELKETSFADLIISKISAYRGKSDKELCLLFSRPYNNNKAQWIDLAYRMLGIKSNKAEEFRKANITVKIIRIEKNGKIRENMAFPPFKYAEIIKEKWENSILHNYFDETKFLFVVFKKKGELYYLQGCQFWNMPNNVLNSCVKKGWESVVSEIRNGIRFSIKETRAGILVENSLPKKNDNPIVHVRPHAKKRYYEFPNGTIIGDGTKSDANQLPDGTWMTHYSFWVNNDYILKQLGDSLVND